MKLLIGDSVVILTGKDKGKTGVILKISKDKSLVKVDGINKQIKHIKGREGNPGERVEFFAPIAISNVAIIDPKTKKPSRIGFKIKDNQKVRIAKKSGDEIVSPKTKKPKTVKA
jgi:large subunit ribosomal protein L24